MVAAAELAGALDGHDVLRLLDDADDRGVAAGVTADPALLGLRHVAAGAAEPHLVLDPVQGRGEPLDVDRFGGEQVERDALRALGPDAGQPAELVDQILDGAFVHACSGRSEAGQAQAAEPAGPPVERAHLLRGQLTGGAVGVADRGDDQVLQRLDVVGVDRRRVDGDRDQLAGAGDGGRDKSAARACP